LSRLRLDQEQCVVENGVAASKGKALEPAIGLAIGRAKKVFTGCAGADRLRQNLPRLEARCGKTSSATLKARLPSERRFSAIYRLFFYPAHKFELRHVSSGR
jgi:hypothetical protein